MKFAHALAIKPVSTELDNLFFLEVGQLNEQKSAEPHRGVSLVAIRLGGSGVPWARQFIARMILHAVHIDVDQTVVPMGLLKFTHVPATELPSLRDLTYKNKSFYLHFVPNGTKLMP